jgi:hypothetical protein
MRLRKSDLRHSVKTDLELRFTNQSLTSYAGLELVGRYFRQLGLAAKLRRRLSGKLPTSDYGVVQMVMLLLTMLIVGGRRVRHLLYLREDPLVRRTSQMRRVPVPSSVGRWLGKFRSRHLKALHQLNEDLVAAVVRMLGLRRLTIDVDGSVVSTGLSVAWARRGFNPHQRKRPSYYPITAYEAQSGQILRTRNRPGNVHDGKGSLGFLRDLFDQIYRSLGLGRVLEFRMDGAFFRRDVIEMLESQRAEYAIKVPFHCWTGLKELVGQQRSWQRIDDAVGFFEKRLFLQPWQRQLRVVIYRKKVHHQTRKNFQLDLFDPADGHYEYSAVATNKELSGRFLWHFMCGRGGHEKAYAELKNGFAFDCVPSLQYAANSAWQLLSVLAFNLMRGFQITTAACRRPFAARRRPLFAFASIHTLRYEFLHQAGILLHPNGRPTLELSSSPAIRRRFLQITQHLPRAA